MQCINCLKKMMTLKSGLILLSLLALPSCSTVEPRIITKTETKIVKVFPSDVWLKPSQYQRVIIETNGDLANTLESAENTIEKCNADKAAIRKWKAENNDTGQSEGEI